ncbi:hypothetical protein [Persicobacter diffluens]|uniref:Uncharacterized protein n=1 Tax=Persicobacter diffluens TaxID=981 RepID=A0AAN4W2V3_9BACT|nr:hypothetical protein PEDI_46540 [Persicobacter diffluens]
MSEMDFNKWLVSLLLPEGIWEFFDILNFGEEDGSIIIFLDKKVINQKEYEGLELWARGFNDARKI